MVNQCNFIGRTGKEVELRYTPGGDAVASVSLAVSEKFKNRQGEQCEKTEWVNLVAWRGLAEVMGKHVNKGDLIFVSGKMQTRKYESQDGQTKYITEIIISDMKMLGGKGRDQNQGGGNRGGMTQPTEPQFNPDDDIPFALPMAYFRDPFDC